MIQPVTRPAITNEESSNDTALMKRPKDLFVLWYEYKFGQSDMWHEYKFGQSDMMKPAKIFTPEERGTSNFGYSRRKVFWDLGVNMIARGYTSDTAIDKICTKYGQALALSTILDTSRNLKRPGVQPCRGWYKRYVISFLYENDVRKIFSLLFPLNHEKKGK